MKRSDRTDHQRCREIRREDRVREPIWHRRVEDDREPVFGDELPGGVDRVAGRGMHPAVRRQDPECRDESACGDGERRREMQPAPDAREAEEHHAQEPGLEKERREHFVGHQRSDDRSGAVGKNRPVRAELVGHHDPGHDAHREGDREDLEPVLKEVEIRFAAGPEPEPFEDGEIAGKPDGKRGEYEVKRDRKGELDSRKRQGGGAFQHASIPGTWRTGRIRPARYSHCSDDGSEAPRARRAWNRDAAPPRSEDHAPWK